MSYALHSSAASAARCYFFIRATGRSNDGIEAGTRLFDVRKRRAGNAIAARSNRLSHSPVGKPVVIVGNWQVLLAPVANWLGRRSNAMTDDFVDRLARRAGIKKVDHYTYRIPAYRVCCSQPTPPFQTANPSCPLPISHSRIARSAGGHSVRGITTGGAPHSAANRR